MRRRIVSFVFLLPTLFFSGATSTQAQRGGIALRQNLAELVDEAAVIVRGPVVSVRVEAHPQFENLYTVVVSLRVEKTMKGETGGLFTFRQFIWDARDRYNAAGYQKGQYVLLLVTRPSEYGLSSPVGLEQGRFRILRAGEDKLLAVNGAGNQGLWRGLKSALIKRGLAVPPRLEQIMTDERGGPIPLDDLEEIIVALSAGR